MNNKNTHLDIVVCGDTHGEWDDLFNRLEALKIENCYLIHTGDIGIGFISPSKQQRQLELLNNRFKKRNVFFLGCRGNHDDPSYFEGQITLSNFELLMDYSLREINGEKFLFVGGGVSIDRIKRIPTISWWAGEEFKFDERFVQKCDVLITHTAPTWNGPTDKKGIESWCKVDLTLWDDCVKERQNMDKLVEACQPKKHYCGHFHLSSFSSVGGCDSRILDINELVEHRNEID